MVQKSICLISADERLKIKSAQFDLTRVQMKNLSMHGSFWTFLCQWPSFEIAKQQKTRKIHHIFRQILPYFAQFLQERNGFKKHKRDLHQTTTQPSTELHTNADWTPTDHYHWWLMMDLFNWSLIAIDVMNVHWSHAARKWQKEKTLQSFFKSCTLINRRNIMQHNMHTKLTAGAWEHC